MNRNNGLKTFALVAAVFLVLSWLRLDPGSGEQTVRGGSAGQDGGTAGDDDGDIGALDEVVDPTNPQSNLVNDPTATGPDPKGLECARGKNGGATDKGVTPTSIRLASTAVLDGPAKSLLEDSPNAMKAVVDKVNKAGGICGRLLELRIVNDSFKADDGLRIIKNFIAEGYFALPVVPSAEGLGSAITSGEIAKAKIPVVGSDGMRKEQYAEPYVWPVASATVTAMRVMAKYGYENRAARSFAIVYDSKYRFGIEGRDAFRDQVRALGGEVKAEIDLDPDLPSYGSKVAEFNGAGKCGQGKCDMVAMLLLPETATKWLKGNPERALRYTAGAQTLFTDRFAADCVQQYGTKCEGMAVWTGYNPPIGPLASLPGVSTYVNDVRAVKANIDVTNQFVEGAYLGMSVFVEALRKVGPNLTRERLKAVMDSMTFTSDLSSPLTWAPGRHYANTRAQSFAMTVSQGTFRGWRNEGTGFLQDPAFG
ncbi:MAG TPA: ABC transporter substrate-binding protein [Acidimicrobiales bacterium]|nr:ABC transporter substrate-binding protein [Acidimicrobiales bacterium]